MIKYAGIVAVVILVLLFIAVRIALNVKPNRYKKKPYTAIGVRLNLYTTLEYTYQKEENYEKSI